MGTPVIRAQDATALGGMVTAVRTVLAQGKPVAVMGDPVTPHPHGNVTMAGTVQAKGVTVKVGGRALARMGDTVTPPCSEPILATATTVQVG